MFVLIRYGEIALKSAPVRERLELALVRNIRSAFRQAGLEAQVRRGYGRIFVEGEAAEKKVAATLEKVFGVVSFSFCETLPADKETIVSACVKQSAGWKGTSFRISCHRVGQHPFSSRDIEMEAGKAILDAGKSKKLTVNLSQPEKTIFVEVRDRDAYLFSEKVKGPGGFPYGTAGRIVSVISKPEGLVSTWLMMRKGLVTHIVFEGKTGKQAGKITAALQKWAPEKLVTETVSAGRLEERIGELAKVYEAVAVDREEFPVQWKKYNTVIFQPLLGLEGKETAALIKRLTAPKGKKI